LAPRSHTWLIRPLPAPRLQLLGQELDREAVRDVLLACLDSGAAAASRPGNSQAGSFLGKLVLPQGQQQQCGSAAAAADAEVEAAARMIVQRLAEAQVEGGGGRGDEEEAGLEQVGGLWGS
jgi:hypothetical protein